MNTIINRIKNITFIMLLGMFVAFPVKSQVTIGSQNSPRKGALLDLKENDESTGGATSKKGMIYPRVNLVNINFLDPILTIADPEYTTVDKRSYTGLIVYNVNPNPPFEKGLYMWDGAKWTALGATEWYLPGGTVDARGDKTSAIYRTGNVGIGTNNPLTTMHIKNQNSDPVIIDSLKFTSDLPNAIDGMNPVYYPLAISKNGVLRKSPPIHDYSQTYIYTLRENITIIPGSSDCVTGSDLLWKQNNVNVPDIVLPEDGAYVFIVRLYGTTSVLTHKSTSYYLGIFKNGKTANNLYDVQEIIISIADPQIYPKATYTAMLTVAGKANDKVYLRIAELDDPKYNMTWQLFSGGLNEKVGNRTSMMFWRVF